MKQAKCKGRETSVKSKIAINERERVDSHESPAGIWEQFQGVKG